MRISTYLPIIAASSFLAVLLQACTEKEIAPESRPELSVNETEIWFSREGGTDTVIVTSEGLDHLNAYSSSSWISLSDIDPETGNLVISVEKTEEIGDLAGEVVVYSELDTTYRIKVTQEGNGIIYDRSSLEIMNLHGKVKELSFYFDPTYVWEQNASYLYNLKFNEAGMLTYMEYFNLNMGGSKINCFCTLSYDDQNRLVNIDVKTDGVISMEDMTPFEYSISLEYGDHGKYVDVERIFGFLEENTTWLWYRVWMPRMIKDIKRVTVYNNVTNPTDFYLDFEINETDGSAYLYTSEEPQLLNAYTFNGQYTATVDYMMNFLGIITTDSRLTYTVEPESGYLTRLVQTSSVMGDTPIMDKTYSDVLCNPLMTYVEGLNFNYNMLIERNENSDIIGISESNHGLQADYQYRYDGNGNWVEITSGNLSIVATYPFETSRTIVYY